MIFFGEERNPTPALPCEQGRERSLGAVLVGPATEQSANVELASPSPSVVLLLPPLLAGEGWGGVALDLPANPHIPLPTSPFSPGDESLRYRNPKV